MASFKLLAIKTAKAKHTGGLEQGRPSFDRSSVSIHSNRIPTMPEGRKPFSGSKPSLVLAFDVGTTFSAISYSILEPGRVPDIHGVTRFPGQEGVGGDSKIPTIIYYDKHGQFRAAGAEATLPNILSMAEEEDWVKAEWFKLHLRPKGSPLNGIAAEDIPPVPLGKTALQVYSDFLRYLLQCAHTYIVDTHAGGDVIWDNAKDSMMYVLTHPNGWEGLQQTQLRTAAVLASLVPNESASLARIQFVTEGEASIHFCITNGLAPESLEKGKGITVIDAGGGTIDVSTYSTTANNMLEEIATPDCCLEGSVFVTLRADQYLQGKLVGSAFGYPDVVHQIAEAFDKTTKLSFRKEDEPAYIRFGTARDRDPNYDIRAGQLKLTGEVVAAFFNPSVNAIVEAVQAQKLQADAPINTIILVGGFAASDWLFAKLRQSLSALDVTFFRPDRHVSKAVADGAISFFLDHFVTSRIARATYGIESRPWFNSNNKEHLEWAHKAFVDSVCGEKFIAGGFAPTLVRGTKVSESMQFRLPFALRRKEKPTSIDFPIFRYTGDLKEPKWFDDDPKHFKELFRVKADISAAAKSFFPRTNRMGKTFYYIDYTVILCFGTTELKAQISWMEKGQEKRSPATILYW